MRVKPCCLSFTYGQNELEDVADGDVGEDNGGGAASTGAHGGQLEGDDGGAGGRKREDSQGLNSAPGFNITRYS